MAKKAGKRMQQEASKDIHNDSTSQDVEDARASNSAVMSGAFIIGLLQVIVYGSTVFPTVPGGDSGELIAVAHVLGVAHPPGYPLFIMLTKAFNLIFPFGTLGYRASLLSCLFGSGAGTLLFLSVCDLTGSIPAAIVSVSLYSFARLQWLYNITGEVFALNNFLVALLVYQFIRFHRNPSLTSACLGALISGLCLSNQHTSVLYIVIAAPWILYHDRKNLVSPGALFLIGIFGLIGLSPYAFSVWSAVKNEAVLTWGDQSNIRGFFKHLLREEYGTFSLAKGGRETASFTLAMSTHANAVSKETFYLGWPLFALGTVLQLPSKQAETCKRVLLAMLVFYMVFFNWRANLDLGNPLLAGVHERFWMQPNMLVALLGGLGFWHVTRKLTKGAKKKDAQDSSSTNLFPLAIAVLLLSAQIAANYNERDESQNIHIRDFGRSLLAGLKNNSILLTYGDLPGNSVRYVHYCEDFRPDVKVIDLEMMTFEWYLKMLEKFYPGVTFPAKVKVYRHGSDFFDMRKFFDANIDKFNIYVYENLNPEDPSWHGHYEVWRHGIVRSIQRAGTRFDPHVWLKETYDWIPSFPIPDPIKYDERTWERVVHDGFVSAGVYLAMQFEEKAGAYLQSDRATAIECFKAAAKIYQKLFDDQVYDGHREDFWHKNYGLVMYNLAQHDVENRDKYGVVIKKHWKAYVESPAQDDQKEQIMQVVNSL
eukprot:m.155089 g.155089  ORF g.155089 m.155089 type:complete len:707 (-) comp15087_c0_seq2:60-2180(-)